MYTVDLPATWIEEREKEIKAARLAEIERAARARAFAQASGEAQESSSANHTPLPSPSTGFGFLSGFFSSFTRSAESTPTMSRSTSACGHCGAPITNSNGNGPVTAAVNNLNKNDKK
ncbi:hypothetical protein ANO11243_020470 [Dothideomycetidae sp. 11243]|nr:hypothetical protein ANO11243_020470 [fungal sp. No.11243]